MSARRAEILREIATRPGMGPRERAALRSAAAVLDDPPPQPTREPDYFLLVPSWEWQPGDPGPELVIATAAPIHCALSGRPLTGMGGPALAISPDVLPAAARAYRRAGR